LAYGLSDVSLFPSLCFIGSAGCDPRYVPIYRKTAEYGKMFGKILLRWGAVLATGVLIVFVVWIAPLFLTPSPARETLFSFDRAFNLDRHGPCRSRRRAAGWSFASLRPHGIFSFADTCWDLGSSLASCSPPGDERYDYFSGVRISRGGDIGSARLRDQCSSIFCVNRVSCNASGSRK